MLLKDYLDTNRINTATFAKDLKVSRQMAGNYVKGISLPTIPMIIRIEEVTGGSVTANDWIEQCKQNKSVDKLDELW